MGVILGRVLLFLVRLLSLVAFLELVLIWLRNAKSLYARKNINIWIIFYIFIYLVFVIKLISLEKLDNNILFGMYGLAVSFYILSRFGLARMYKPVPKTVKNGSDLTISFAVPAKDEEDNIRETILRIAYSDYPRDKFDIIVINDGSKDNTLDEIYIAREVAAGLGVNVRVIDWLENRGKREGMAECVRLSNNDVIVFIDSDSFVRPDTARELVKYFSHSKVSAVAGHAYVANAETNFLTKMQDVRYFVAFKAYKAAEALFGSVTCCSGCCSAYRRSHLMEILDQWQYQKFLGVQCTYGDDRSLTNYLLAKGYKAVFAPLAIVHTVVPDTFSQFMKQQLRWKKSWVRENFKASFFIWKKNIIMSIFFYLGFILPLLAPVVLIRAFIWYPWTTGLLPWFYIFGLLLMAFIHGLYYYAHTKNGRWIYGTMFTIFYTIILIWQLPWAIINLRDSKWGTR